MSKLNEAHVRSTLRVHNLECVRGDRSLFRDIAFDLQNGSLLQVRGQNGSGKTSLLRIICGLLPPATGKIAWNGTPMREAADDYKASLSYVGHLNGVKDEFDAIENLRLSARLVGLESSDAAVHDALEGFGLSAVKHLPCKVLSQGQRRRLALARLKLSRARPLWVLDEPFAALDSAGITAMSSLLEDHLARGGLALLTTHQDVPIVAPGMQSIQLGQ